MEHVPVPFDIEIANTRGVEAEEVILRGSIEGGRITSVPGNCTTSGSAEVTCRYERLNSHYPLTPTIEVEPYDAPIMVNSSFEVATGSREYKREDNEARDSTEVISRIDLQVDFVEVTQGIQDRRHSIPLVRDKTTYARAHVRGVRHTVDSGDILVDVEGTSVELEGRDKSGPLPGSPIRPVPGAPTSLRQVADSVSGTSVTINSGDSLYNHTAMGEVRGGSDGFRFTGSVPAVALDNPAGADITVNDENRIVVTGEGKPGGTAYTLEVESNLTQLESGTLIGHNVTKQSDDEVSGDTIATGRVGNGADGFIYEGELTSLKLENPGAATVLSENGGTILIEGKGSGTEYTIADTTKLDANTLDRHGREAFDFRLPAEWVDGEEIELEATVNPDGMLTEHGGGLDNTKETDRYELWELAPVCMRTQPVRAGSDLPDADLTNTEKGRKILNLAETLLPTPRIRIYPNDNAVTPGIFEWGGEFEFGDDPGEPPLYNENDHDGAKVNTLLYWRSLTGTSPSWCDDEGARTHWVGLIREDDYTVRLTAVDSDGKQARDSRTFVVGPMEGPGAGGTGEKTFEPGDQTPGRTTPAAGGPQTGKNADIQTAGSASSVTLIARGGASLPGVSSMGDLTGELGATLEGQKAVFSWGGSIALGSPGSYNFHLSGLHRSSAIVTAQQGGQPGATEMDERFTAFSADLILRPVPRILWIQPYASGGLGMRKVSYAGEASTGVDDSWKPAAPLGVGADIRLGTNGLLFGVEMVDYISNFSADGGLRHDAFVLGFLGIPL